MFKTFAKWTAKIAASVAIAYAVPPLAFVAGIALAGDIFWTTCVKPEMARIDARR